MNFDISKYTEHVPALLTGVAIGATFVFTFIYQPSKDINEKTYNKQLELIQKENTNIILEKDKETTSLKQHISSLSEMLEKQKQENEIIKKENLSLNSKIPKTPKRITYTIGNDGDIWDEKEYGIYIIRNNSAVFAGLEHIYFDIKLGSSESKSEINQNNFKSFVQTFRKNGESFKLTIEQFKPIIFVVTKE